MAKKLVLIDGSGFIYRAFHALPPLTSKFDNSPVGAVYGFCNMLCSVLKNHQYDYIAVAFDAGRRNFRHDIYPNYKAHRKEVPEDLIPQFPLIRQICEILAVSSIEQPGFEADDIIATYSTLATQSGISTEIISSDKDLIQLVNESVSIFDPIKSVTLSEELIFNKYGITSRQIVDFFALTGDSSDNIPGVKGIGVKTAAALLQKFQSLDNIYNNLNQIQQEKILRNLAEGKNAAYTSKQLITLRKDVPTDNSIHSFAKKTLSESHILRAETFFKQHGFNSILKRINSLVPLSATRHLEPGQQPADLESHAENTEVTDSIAPVKTLETSNTVEIAEYIKKAQSTKQIAINILYAPKSAEVVRVQIACDSCSCLQIYLPSNQNNAAQRDLLDIDKNLALTLSELTSLLDYILEDDQILKIGFNIKKWGKIFGLKKFYNCVDIDLISYVLYGPHNNSFEQIAEQQLALRNEQINAAHMITLYGKLFSALAQDSQLYNVYKNIEFPLVNILSAMERFGVLVDRTKLQNESIKLKSQLSTISQKIYEITFQEFNIASPRQVAEILVKHCNVKSIKDTSSSTLKKIVDQGSKLAELILEWRKLSKLKNTYADTFLKYADPRTSRIHTEFCMTSTVTGRLSSKEPNMQNIPVRTPEGQFFREVIVAPPNHMLLTVDYSQIELRVLAHFANIEVMKDAFRNKEDIHTLTASEIFNTPRKNVNDDMRRHAKAINFGIIYGMKAHGLSERLNISHQEADAYIKSYFKHYPGIEEYMRKVVTFAQNNEFVETITKRKCYIKDINAKNSNIRNFAQRQAINAIIQGSAADIIKIAMINVDKIINEESLDIKLILQIHDELLFEVSSRIQENEIFMIKQAMEQSVKISVPLDVDYGIGKGWMQALKM